MSIYWDNQLYQLSNYDMQRFAMKHSYGRVTIKQIIERFGYEPTAELVLDGIRFNGEPATGRVKVTMKEYYHFDTDATLDRKVRRYVINGFKSASAKRAITCSYDEFRHQIEVTTFYQQFTRAKDTIMEEEKQMVLAELEKNLCEAARQAYADDIFQLVKDKKFGELRQWYVDHGFTNVPPSIDQMHKLDSFITSSKPDGWGHQCGTGMNVDYEKKTFSAFGWSSDD